MKLRGDNWFALARLAADETPTPPAKSGASILTVALLLGAGVAAIALVDWGNLLGGR